MTAESGGTTVLGKQVSDLQSDVSVGTSAITGTLIKNEGWASGPLEGEGYFLALKFTASDWNAYDSVKVGLNPSEGTGLVDVLSDPDKNGVFKITNKATQKFVIEARKGATVVRKEWTLSGLTLQEPTPPTPPTPVVDTSKIWRAPEVTGTTYPDGSGQVNVIQANVQIEDDIQDLSNIQSTAEGTISGMFASYDNSKYYLGLNFEDDFISKYSSYGMYDIHIAYTGYDNSDTEVTNGSGVVSNMAEKKFAIEIAGTVKKLVVSLRVSAFGSDVDTTTITYETSFTAT